jgi:hypothetical protein
MRLQHGNQRNIKSLHVPELYGQSIVLSNLREHEQASSLPLHRFYSLEAPSSEVHEISG